MKFTGSLEDLKQTISCCGFTVEDVRDQEHGYQIRTKEGAIANWYESTGTLIIQGKKEPKQKFQEAWSSYTGSDVSDMRPTASVIPAPPATTDVQNKKVFVVHGHDSNAKEQLELILHKLGLDPFVLANTGGGGLTIIEALEKEIGPSGTQARFGIVLMTPDDKGYAKADGPDAIKDRARQNVVLEMGMLIAALRRPNVAILQKGYLEVPSDAQGILYIPFNDHVKETVPKLTDRLREAGFILSPERISNASA